MSDYEAVWSQLRKQIDDMEIRSIDQYTFYRLCKLNGICSDMRKIYSKWPTDSDPENFIKDSINTVNHNIDLPKDIRYICWYFNYGTQKRHKCPCCQSKTIYLNNYWHAGHIKAKSKGGDNNPFTNLIPICPKCNEDMGDRHMAEYIILPKGAKRTRKRNLEKEMTMIRVEAYKSFNCKSQEGLKILLYNTYRDKKIEGVYEIINTIRLANKSKK